MGGPRQSLMGNGRRDPTGLICRGHLGKDLICCGPVFAEGRTLGKGLFAEGRSLPRAPVAGPRQIVSLPSARDLALGKARFSSSGVLFSS